MRLSREDLAELAAVLSGSSYSCLRVEAEGFAALLTCDEYGWRAEITEHAGTAAQNVAEIAQDETITAHAPAVRAPLVGTFYRASKPGAAPFVDVGSRVSPDTVIGIIETMKLMNSVHAGLHGVVSEIVVADSQFVENGQVLMRVEERAT